MMPVGNETGLKVITGAPGAALDFGRGTLKLGAPDISESENTSPLMEEMSEQDGECARRSGGQIGPRDWQVLGGAGRGAGGELDGVEVAGDRPGVRIITDTLSLVDNKSSVSSLTDSWRAKGIAQECPNFPTFLWLRSSLLTRLLALHSS